MAARIGSNHFYYLCVLKSYSKAVFVKHSPAQADVLLYLLFPVRGAKESRYQLSSITFQQNGVLQ